MALRSAATVPWNIGPRAIAPRRCESAPLAPDATPFLPFGPPGGPATAQEAVRVPGLRAALCRAGLASRIPQAEHWCEAMGAVYLSECVENIGELAGALQLDAESTRAFLEVVPPCGQDSVPLPASRMDGIRRW